MSDPVPSIPQQGIVQQSTEGGTIHALFFSFFNYEIENIFRVSIKL